MASRKDSKNSTTLLLVVLILLLLLAGWLAWKWVSVPTGAQTYTSRTTAQTTSSGYNRSTGTYNTTTTRTTETFSAPAISFATPEAPRPAAATVQSGTAQPAAQRAGAQSTQFSTRPAGAEQAAVASSTHTPPRSTTPKKSAAPKTTSTRVPSSATTAGTSDFSASNADSGSSRALAHPTRPTYIIPPTDSINTVAQTVQTGPMPGSPIEGYAIVRGKQQDAVTGRCYLYCAADKSNLTYTYEVDSATYNEAAPGLMYNPSKVANWKFVSSQ